MITKPLLDDVRKDVMIALGEVAKKHGLSVLPEVRITYDASTFYFNKITFAEGNLEDVERKDFESRCFFYNLDKSDYLARFAKGDEILELVGIVPSRSKYPIKMRNVVTNKVMLYTTDVFKSYLKIAE